MTKTEDRRKDEDSFWLDSETSLVREEPDSKPVSDLEERTARFDEAIINFARKIPSGPLTVGAGTSVRANYSEADDSVSEFLKCIDTCKKGARETKHFLRMVAPAVPELQADARQLWMEARALHLIFAKIWRTRKRRGMKTPMRLRHSGFVIISSFVIPHSSFL